MVAVGFALQAAISVSAAGAQQAADLRIMVETDWTAQEKEKGREPHAKHVELPDADRRRISIWLDGNAPLYGTYREEAQRAQFAGQAVPPPVLQ